MILNQTLCSSHLCSLSCPHRLRIRRNSWYDAPRIGNFPGMEIIICFPSGRRSHLANAKRKVSFPFCCVLLLSHFFWLIDLYHGQDYKAWPDTKTKHTTRGNHKESKKQKSCSLSANVSKAAISLISCTQMKGQMMICISGCGCLLLSSARFSFISNRPGSWLRLF